MIDLQSFILTYVNNFSYFGVFLLLAIIALIPIPEEIVLLLIGYFAASGFAELDKIIISSILGVIIGDNVLFLLSKHGSKYVNKLKNKFAPKTFAKYDKLMKGHIGKTIFLLRFIIGLRFLGPITAGTNKAKWKTFFIFNTLAILIFVPAFILIGYKFNSFLSNIIEKILVVKHIVVISIIMLIFLSLYLVINKKLQKL